MYWLLILALTQTWQAGAPMPTPGYGFACAEVDGCIYAIGGLTGSLESPAARLVNEAYDVAADSWITGLAPMPVPRWFSGCVAYGGKIYVIGGTDGQSESGRVDRYDPYTDSWDTVAPLPWPAQAVAAGAYRHSIYVAGGFSSSHGAFLRRVARFDPGTLSWAEVDSLETPRASPALAVAADKLHAVGGCYFNCLASSEYYAPDRWDNLSGLLHNRRAGLAAIGWNDQVIAVGGFGPAPLSSVELLNTGTGEWTLLESLAEARCYLGAELVGTRVAVVGGVGVYGSVGSVEVADSLFFVPGVEEEPVPVSRMPDLPGVISGPVKLDAGRRCSVWDDCGRLVARAAGPLELRLTPGVYFLHLDGSETRKFTVVR